MTDDEPRGTVRGDKMTTEFFENVLLGYLEDDRIESGVLRLELDDGATRRIVVDDDTESLDPYEYILRELAEVITLIEETEDLLDEPVELSIPVSDTGRVIEEVRDEETITTLFQSGGVQILIEHLHELVEEEQARADHADTSGE